MAENPLTSPPRKRQRSENEKPQQSESTKPSVTITQQIRRDTLLEIEKMVTNLRSDPGLLDKCKSLCANNLQRYKNDDEMLESAACIIVDKSVTQPDLTYNGARLCFYLSRKVYDNQIATFQQVLLAKCERDLQRSKSTLRGDPARFHGQINFVGKLFAISIACAAGKPLNLEKAVCRLMSLLLDLPTDDNLHCFGGVLELTGLFMSNETCFQNVLCKLKEVLGDGRNEIDVRRKKMLIGSLGFYQTGRRRRSEDALGWDLTSSFRGRNERLVDFAGFMERLLKDKRDEIEVSPPYSCKAVTRVLHLLSSV